MQLTGSRARVCLITPGHLSSAPRIVKEAEALTEAGYDVHVVSASHFDLAEPFDQSIVRRATWNNIRVRTYEGAGVLWRRIQRRWLRRFRPAPEDISLATATILAHPGLSRLTEAAVATGAAFFHGHCVAGLAAAAHAASRLRVRYGFDAEDFHEAETDAVEQDPFERAIVARIMESFLGGAALVTAASPLIAAEYHRRYGLVADVVLNAFPRRDAPSGLPHRQRIDKASPARMYWFSQAIGPGRGLEGMIAVLGMMKTPAELQLRGMALPMEAARLRGLAANAGVAHALKLLAPEPPDDMVRLAALADLGLSLEETRPRNRDLCLTNKVFAYLLAGVPQLLSPTAAQAALAPELGTAAIVGDFSRPQAVAAALDEFFADERRVALSRQAARALGESRYCWEMEKPTLLRAFERGLA